MRATASQQHLVSPWIDPWLFRHAAPGAPDPDVAAAAACRA